MTVMSMGRARVVVLGSDFNDPTNERLILLSAAGLVVIGAVLLVVTILWWRRGRQEHPSLAPLEIMGTRSWTKAPQGDRQRRLQRVRPEGTGPAPDEPVRPEPVDLQALVRSVPQAFDDLREPGQSDHVVEVSQVSQVSEAQAAAEVAVEPVPAPAPAPANEAVALVAAVDPDATSFTAERPSIVPPPPPPPPPPVDEHPAAGANGDIAGAVTASHGDQP